jgi:hypothetical protein
MSELTWYCRVGEQQIGPLTLQQLRRLAAKGELKLTSLVRRSDVASWTEAGQIPDLWPRAAALPPDPTDATARPIAPPIALPIRAPQSPPAAQSRPLAPPNASRPQTVPAQAVPAQAVQPVQPHVAPPPQALPSGIPLAPGQVPASPPTFPVGARFPGSPVVRPANAPVPVMPAASQRDPAEGPKTKQQLRREQARRKLLILLSIAGGFLLVLIFTAIFVATRSSKPTVASNSTPSPDAAAANTAVTATTAPPAVASPSIPAISPASATSTSPPASAPSMPSGISETGTTVARSSASPAAPSPTMPSGLEFDSLVASVRPWRTTNSVSSPTARIQWVGAWLASAKPNPTQTGGGQTPPTVVDDAAPSSAVPSPPDTTPPDTTPPDATPPGAKPADTTPSSVVSAPRYLCVELRVTVPERAAAPLNYSGWNTLSAKASLPTAFLVDPASKPLAFVPPSQFADASRQTKAIKIKPGQAVTDLLVFAAPTGDFEHVRLGLKMSVFGQGDRYLGFHLTRDAIANERPVELADSPTTRARPTAAVAAQEEMAGDAPSTPATEASPKPPREETILDLKKQIEEMAKETKAAKDRERKKQEEEEKKKSETDDKKDESP